MNASMTTNDRPMTKVTRSSGTGRVAGSDDGLDVLDVYLHQIGTVALLSAERERELAEQMVAGRRELDEACDEHARRAARRRIDEARRELTEANLRLVVSTAKRYMRDGVRLLDLVQEGNIALMQAVDKFDPTRGCRFSTYAVYWLRQAMGYSLSRNRRVVRLPRAKSDAINRVHRASRELQQAGCTEPTSAELASACEIAEHEVGELAALSRPDVSLDEPCFDDQDASLGESLADTSSVGPEESVHRVTVGERVKKAVAKLPARERRIVRMRFGLGRHREHSLEQIGKVLGVTRERIRQLEVRALGQLRELVPEWQAV